jgi:hypothetical protein
MDQEQQDRADALVLAQALERDQEAEKQRRAENQRLYERTRDQLDANSRSMAESYDREVLALSSAFLGGSLGFIDNVIKLETADYRWLVYAAWGLLVVTIILTLASLLHGLYSIRELREAARQYYMEDNAVAWDVSDKKEREAFYFLFAYGITFSVGVVCLALFIALNLGQGADVYETQELHVQLEERGIPSAPFPPAQPAPVAPVVPQSNPPQPLEKKASDSSANEYKGMPLLPHPGTPKPPIADTSVPPSPFEKPQPTKPPASPK